MKIIVKAKPSAKREKVEKIGENNFTVSVKEPAKEGRANKAVIRTLAGYFGVSKSKLRILSGQTSKQKIIEIS